MTSDAGNAESPPPELELEPELLDELLLEDVELELLDELEEPDEEDDELELPLDEDPTIPVEALSTEVGMFMI